MQDTLSEITLNLGVSSLSCLLAAMILKLPCLRFNRKEIFKYTSLIKAIKYFWGFLIGVSFVGSEGAYLVKSLSFTLVFISTTVLLIAAYDFYMTEKDVTVGMGPQPAFEDFFHMYEKKAAEN
jgi:hypothetical protein